MRDHLNKILSLGAGVQSTAVLLMSCIGKLEKLDAAIFADTGWEPKAVYTHLDWLEKEAEKHGIPVYRVSKGNIKEDAMVSQMRSKKTNGKRWAAMPLRIRNADGTIGMIRRQCTSEYKIYPVEKKIRELLGYKRYQRIPAGSVEQWFGITLDEKQRMRLSDRVWIDFHYPLIFDVPMNRHECLLWMEKQGYPRPPRSACIGCPYRANEEWRNLTPEEWQDAVEFDRAIRHCGGMRGDVFIHKDAVPLDEADLSTEEERGQQSLWDLECAGVCGV